MKATHIYFQLMITMWKQATECSLLSVTSSTHQLWGHSWEKEILFPVGTPLQQEWSALQSSCHQELQYIFLNKRLTDLKPLQTTAFNLGFLTAARYKWSEPWWWWEPLKHSRWPTTIILLRHIQYMLPKLCSHCAAKKGLSKIYLLLPLGQWYANHCLGVDLQLFGQHTAVLHTIKFLLLDHYEERVQTLKCK